jgi:uncharacterized protein (DUF2132 family)
MLGRLYCLKNSIYWLLLPHACLAALSPGLYYWETRLQAETLTFWWKPRPKIIEKPQSTFRGDQSVMRSLKFLNHTFWALREPHLNILLGQHALPSAPLSPDSTLPFQPALSSLAVALIRFPTVNTFHRARKWTSAWTEPLICLLQSPTMIWYVSVTLAVALGR